MRKPLYYIIAALLTAITMASCSNTKNTGLSRNVQAIKARYNTYYNGSLAFIDGRTAQEDGNKDNYTEVIPVFMTDNKTTAKLGTSNFDRTIEKCQKTIKQHSITKRPQWHGSKAKKPKDRIWLSQKEYNPFLYKAWFLLGNAQMRKGEYMEAASTFAYMQNVYFSKPNIVAKARVLEAKCYASMDWFYDAEDILLRAQKDSFPTNLANMKASVEASMQVKQKMYAEAIPNVLKAVKATNRSIEKARLYYLLGQLCQRTGNTADAYKYYSKVISRNPPYQLEFNARIARTEAMSKGQSRQMIRKLQSMARNPKNKDYLDQVYYAIGNIYMAKGDSVHAEWAYRDGVDKATRSGIEKGVLLVTLGELYWKQEKFVKAQECYAQALGSFDKDHERYEEIDERTKILEELLPHAQAVELQDSLQRLAHMDSVTRTATLMKHIEWVKKQEKEQEKKANDAANAAAANANRPVNTNQSNTGNRNGQQTATWYFYNPTAVAAGKAEFERKWGKRKLADDWQRMNKTVLDDFNETVNDSITENALLSDSIANDSTMTASDSLATGQTAMNPDEQAANKPLSAKEEKAAKKLEEYAKDPHRIEYYLKDIPFSDEQMAASDAALVAGLYGSAIIYKDRMENLPLAERTFRRITEHFPDFDKQEELYYNMFQLYSRMGDAANADLYRSKLIAEFAESERTQTISDPNFMYKALYGKSIEDSIYSHAYESYKSGEYANVLADNSLAEREYPQGENRPRFLFISAMSRLEMGEREGFMNDMKTLVEKYPKSTVSELAGLYVKGLKEGRLLASGKFETGSIWERRRGLIEDGDSVAADTTFSLERNCDFTFAIAYERDSIDENQLLFEMARYNFTNFSVRNFEMAFEKGDGIDMLQVHTFLNYDEAYIYLHRLMNNAEMARKLQGLRTFIISDENLKKLMKGLSFADYFDFYDANFDRIGSLRISEDDENLLDEPTDIPDIEDMEDKPAEEEEEYDDDNFIF